MIKKYLLLFFIFETLTYANTLNLDNLLNYLEKTSYQKEIYKVRKNRDLKREEIYKLDDFNGIKTSGETEYNSEDKGYKNSGKLEYGVFYVKGESWKNDDSSAQFGVEKNIKDFIYSENDSNLTKLNIEKIMENIEFKKKLEEQKVALTNLYRDYINIKLEIAIRKNALRTLDKEKEILEKSYTMGKIPKIDLDSLLYSYENIEFEIEKLEIEKYNTRQEFLYTFKINLDSINLELIDSKNIIINKYLEKIGEKDIYKSNLSKNITEENIKYLSYKNRVPDITLGAERDTGIDDNRVFLKISKDLFYKDINLENEKSSLKEQKIELEQKIRDTKSERIQYKNRYVNLKKEHAILRNNRTLEESKYNIKKLESQLGKIGYLDVMESFNDYLEFKINEEKANNTLNALIYEIKIRGEQNIWLKK